MENSKTSIKQVKKWTGNIIFVLGLILVTFLLFSVVLSKLSDGPPTVAGRQLYIVIGGSMSPTFEAGSLAIIEPIMHDAIQVGDVITYKGLTSKSATTHRVVKIQNIDGELKFTTRGDANDVDDPTLIESQQIIGRVAFTMPYMGRLMNFAQSKFGLILLVIIPGIVLIIYESQSVIHTISKMKSEKSSSIGSNETPDAME